MEVKVLKAGELNINKEVIVLSQTRAAEVSKPTVFLLKIRSCFLQLFSYSTSWFCMKTFCEKPSQKEKRISLRQTNYHLPLSPPVDEEGKVWFYNPRCTAEWSSRGQPRPPPWSHKRPIWVNFWLLAQTQKKAKAKKCAPLLDLEVVHPKLPILRSSRSVHCSTCKADAFRLCQNLPSWWMGVF